MEPSEVTLSPTPWPRLRVEDWQDTRDTLHLWTQIIGKIRMAHTPLVNHWWQVPLYVSARGLTTSAVPYYGGVFDAEFDFIDHELRIRSSSGAATAIALRAKATSEFHAQVVDAMGRLGVSTNIRESPVEVEPSIPFSQDHQHVSYDPGAAQLFWRQLIQADRVFNRFRSYFSGKVSPVHYFWGSMDLACTRFSGRKAPRHPGGAINCADWVMVEGYSHELSSCGFWPGGGDEGAFYTYAYPEPAGFASADLMVDGAAYNQEAKLFLLPYEHVRLAADPDAELLRFLQAGYAAAADAADWDRSALEVDPHRLRGYLG